MVQSLKERSSSIAGYMLHKGTARCGVMIEGLKKETPFKSEIKTGNMDDFLEVWVKIKQSIEKQC